MVDIEAAAFMTGLSEEERAKMAALDKHKRFNDPGVFCEGMGVFCPIYD